MSLFPVSEQTISEDISQSGSESEVSDDDDLGEDLIDAFENAMEGGAFGFTGSYAIGQVVPAPNPCLSIEGIGAIGQPLSPRDAQLIIQRAAQAPYGHGDQTIVNTSVRDTWEIEPANVKFENEEWQSFVANTVVQMVATALGAGPVQTLKAELYKLLLYQEGSHFLPHQDTVKAPGMFATIVIVLPSPYTGGQVHVSHSKHSRVFDFAAQSRLGTSILAWYTDVRHEVKPITSGYRLALSYNLSRITSETPAPSLPDMHGALSEVQRVLRRWQDERFDQCPELLAYILDHEYSRFGLKGGLKELKGSDKHKVTHLLEAAGELGYTIFLANLAYQKTGEPEESDFGYGYHHKRGGWGRRRYGGYSDYSDDDEGDDGTHTMLEVHDTSLSISHVVDPDGNAVMDADSSITIDQDSLVPKDPFEDAEPDDETYEGYMGNWSGSLEHYYRRTVLILIQQDDADGLFLRGRGGLTYALGKISTNAVPSAQDRKLAMLILSKWNSYSDQGIVLSVANHALRWNDVQIWRTALKSSGYSLKTFPIEQLHLALNRFSFVAIRDSLTEILQTQKQLAHQFDFLSKIRNGVTGQDRAQIDQWYREKAALCLSSIKSPNVDDVPIILQVLLNNGLAYIASSVIPQLKKDTTIFPFWVAFIKSLGTYKSQILDSAPTITGDRQAVVATYEGLVNDLMQTVTGLWETVVASPYNHYGYGADPSSASKVSRAIEIVELCFLHGKTVLCRELCRLMVQSGKKDWPRNFHHVISPFISSLKLILATRNINLWQSPFAEIMHYFIATYLHNVLRSKPATQAPAIPNLGCGCQDCRNLNAFLQSPQAAQGFQLVQARRTHLERYLSTIRGPVNFHTISRGSPHTLQVSKRADIVAGNEWVARKAAAQAFLNGIGDAPTIQRIMGARYQEVVDSVEGKAPFSQNPRTTSAPRRETAPALTGSGRSNAQSATSTATSASTTAGIKRRHDPVSLGVIDLTGDD